MKKSLVLLAAFWGLCSLSFSENTLLYSLKNRIYDMSSRPYFKSNELHALVSDISNKGNVNDISVRDLYWNTYQEDSVLSRMIDSQQSDGSWADINYKDPALSNWKPLTHANRLLYVCRAYISPASRFYQKKEVSAFLHRGLSFWFQAKPICKNWWYNQIGVPRNLGLVFLFLENELTTSEKAEAVKVMDKSAFRMTGQNKVWLAGNVLLKALLINDEVLAKAARDTIASEIFTTTGEGVQPDFSFHQHGPQQQFGNYGLAYIASLSYYANVFGGSPFAFTAKQLDILRNYLLDGQNWIDWRGYFDVSACNRQVFKQTQRGKSLALCVAVDQLRRADLPNGKLYDDFIKRNLYSGNGGEKPMAKHFWRSDLSVFRASNFYISVRACSPRVIGTEFTNHENKKGHFISDGTTILMCRGDEYKDIFPIWDWNRLPGVTAPVLDTIIPNVKNDNYRNSNHFVGGLTLGTNGISTFHLARNGVDAKKSWFYINGVFVCLGSGIQTHCDKEIVTGINQVLQKGFAFITMQKGVSKQAVDTVLNSSLVKSVWHDSIGYYFPKQTNVSMSLQPQSGSWHDISDTYSSDKVSGRVFKLYINHGVNGLANPSYQYVILPNVSQSQLATFEKKPTVEILENSVAVQSVRLKDNSLIQFVFHQPARVKTFSNSEYLETYTAGLVMMSRNQSNGLTITVADPTQKEKVFRIDLRGKYTAPNAVYNQKKNTTALSIFLPDGGDAGRSVTIYLKKN